MSGCACINGCGGVNIYMLPTSFIAAIKNPRSFMMSRSHAWSIKPNVFLKSMFAIYIYIYIVLFHLHLLALL